MSTFVEQCNRYAVLYYMDPILDRRSFHSHGTKIEAHASLKLLRTNLNLLNDLP